MTFKEIAGYARRTLNDVTGLLSVCGLGKTTRWLAAALLNVRSIARTRTFAAADWAMGPGPFQISYRGLRFRVCGPGVFGGIREMYVRDVYFQGGWFDIPKSARVVDLGANIGNFTNLALAHDPGVRVVAVEPSRCLLKDFHASIELNGASSRVQVVRAFVGGNTRKQMDCQADPCYAGASFMTDAEFVSSIGEGPIDFLKCDIEGSEFDLLTPGSAILESTQRLAIEIHAFAGDVRNFIQGLADCGFEIGPVKWDPDGSCIMLARRPLRHDRVLTRA